MFDAAPKLPAVGNARQHFSDKECDNAVNYLRQQSPKHSAVGVLSPSQRIIFVVGAILIVASLIAAPTAMFVTLNLFFATYFILAVTYRIFLMITGRRRKVSAPLSRNKSNTHSLPVITILAPLYRDANSLSGLSHAIDALDYPPEKKDIKLLLEADDFATIAEAGRLNLDRQYDVIIVPNIGPRTKPKACNFGLLRARGELAVIYDAEDQPEKDQLLKAAAAFSVGDENLACLQARLNYYNADENWLTRLFTLEYALWFDWLLPALQKLRAPIPLGGTSNFFRTEVLRAVGAWDPFNVTEDADLGLRLAKLGYRVEMLNSTTFEEANCRLGNWIRQRSRWIKGHLQTWLVHMRQPGGFISQNGWHGLLSIQLFLAGNVAGALVNPILWGAFAYSNIFGGSALETPMPPELQILNLTALLVGNFCFVLCAIVAPLKRGWRHLCLFGLTAPAYWLLTSIAAYKALWQIVIRPYYWEKTDHMISRMAAQRRLPMTTRAPAQ